MKTVDQRQKGTKAANSTSGASPLIRQCVQPNHVAMRLPMWPGILLKADSRNRIGGQSCATSSPHERPLIIAGLHQTGDMSLRVCTCRRSRSGVGIIVLGVDTSGSIGEEELEQFAGEISAIADEAKPEAIHVVYCDAACRFIARVQTVRTNSAGTEGRRRHRFPPSLRMG